MFSRFTSTPELGPFDWKLKPSRPDRLRFRLHQSLMVPSARLRLRGGPRLSLYLRRLVGDYESPLVAEATDVRISFSGFDRYWMQVFFRKDFYEPELYRFFKRCTKLDAFHLIDGGANIGFWSAVLTSHEFGIRRAVALEASPATYEALARTASLCDQRFATEHRAVTRTAGRVEFAVDVPHASRHITKDAGPNTISVESTTIDALVKRHALDPEHLLIKLDVEGAELDCVLGGAEAFAAGAVWVYEDHGKDPSSRLTEGLLDHGAACWFMTDNGGLIPVTSAAEASNHKTVVGRGYNFLCIAQGHAASLEQRLGLSVSA